LVKKRCTFGFKSFLKQQQQITERFNNYYLDSCTSQGTKLTFFSRSHLAPKYFKEVANTKKLVASFLKIKKFLVLLCDFEELDPPES